MTPYIHHVKYYECDRMGIVHHSNYARFMEEARCDLLEQLGYPFNKMEEEGIVSPVVCLQIDFKKPTTFPDAIEIEVRTKEMHDESRRSALRPRHKHTLLPRPRRQTLTICGQMA